MRQSFSQENTPHKGNGHSLNHYFLEEQDMSSNTVTYDDAIVSNYDQYKK